jgi:hypothetical protein
MGFQRHIPPSKIWRNLARRGKICVLQMGGCQIEGRNYLSRKLWHLIRFLHTGKHEFSRRIKPKQKQAWLLRKFAKPVHWNGREDHVAFLSNDSKITPADQQWVTDDHRDLLQMARDVLISEMRLRTTSNARQSYGRQKNRKRKRPDPQATPPPPQMQPHP